MQLYIMLYMKQTDIYCFT